NTTETICRDFYNTRIEIPSLAALESEKLVKGELDTDYSKFPDFGRTTPGGLADYKLFVRNVGTVPMTDVVLIDILPFIGDQGVIDLSNRNSQWRPNLVGPVTAPPGVTVYYSTASNPCRDELTPGIPAVCDAPNWTTAIPQDVTTIQSLKFDFGTTVINPGDELELNWPMRAPVNAPTAGEIAWNSFGYIATRVDNGDAILPSEPIKVGIQIEPVEPAAYGDFVWLDVNQNGVQDGGEVGLDNVRVELYKDNGDGIVDVTVDQMVSFTLTANGGFYLFPSLDIGDYYAVFHIPPTYNLSPFQNTGATGYTTSNDSDGQATTIGAFTVAITPITTLVALEDDRTWDIGLYQDNPPKAALGNYVWNDLNSNGVQDESALAGINGVTVNLYQSDGTTLVSTITTANDLNGNPGYYLFDQLDPDIDYIVEFVLPNYGGGLTNPVFTTAEQGAGGSDTNDSDAVVTADPLIARTSIIDLNSGVYDDAWDAGVIWPASNLSLGNQIWEDTNDNGIYDYLTGEQGINGVKVNLYVDTDNSGDFSAGDVLYATTTTYTNGGLVGYYSFDNLQEGDYIVAIDASNFNSSSPLNGMISSTGNDLGDNTAPDPDGSGYTDHDDSGYTTALGIIASKTIHLQDDSGSDPNTDGDGDGTSNRTVDFGFFNFTCPAITALSSNFSSVCLGSTDVTLTIHHEANPGDLALYYSTTLLTATDLYSLGNGGATIIIDPLSPTIAATSTNHNFTVPNVAGIYYIYAIFGGSNPNINDPNCQPMVIRSVTVYESPDAGLDNTALTVCNSSGDTIDLNDHLSSADSGGVWTETTGVPSGSFNAATGVLTGTGLTAGNAYTFTYTVSNSGPPACNQDVANFTVTIQNCCPSGKCGRVNVVRN
ncbi:MAG: SdrD B-like domain-containing protein, partial [Chitinophagales bacterium]